jgi:hypothetical protein
MQYTIIVMMGFDSIWIVVFEDSFFKLISYTPFNIHQMSFNVFFPLEIWENCISNLLDMDMWPSKSTSRDTTFNIRVVFKNILDQ